MRPTHTVTVVVDAAGRARARRLPVFRLEVLKGPDRRRQLRCARSPVRVGSAPGADLELTDPTVSALHCELLSDEAGIRVRDLGSKNGVLVEGRRVVEAFLADGDRLAVGATLLRFRLLDEVEDEPLAQRTSFGRLLGSSLAMRQLYGQLERAAASDAPVLLVGETGSGKELAAEALVTAGPRSGGPLVVVDCGRLPIGLAESELFGHEEGAFTGAGRQHLGAFERAAGGTVFLDEVGELPLDLQPKLLGVLERRQLQRVGGHEALPVNARIISATHRDLERGVNQGSFRVDLYYRLSALTLRVPPLREHPEDIPLLVSHFLEELGAVDPLSPGALARLFEGDYPGNVRELRNAVERAACGLEVAQAQAPAAAGHRVDPALPYKVQKDRLVDGFERAFFEQQLEACEGNLSELARRSGLSRFHVHEVVRRLGLRDGRRAGRAQRS